jgi:hypothetical protein
VAGTCEMRRSWGGVSLWDEARDRGAVEARGVGWPLEKMSCSVTLRTDMFWELVHRNPCTPLAHNGKEMDN